MVSAVKKSIILASFIISALAVPSPKVVAKRFDDAASGEWSGIWKWPSPQPPSNPASPVIPAPAPPPSSSTGSAAQMYLATHNHVRSAHAASPLTWSNTLANAAQTWANRCQTVHSGGSVGPYGENLAWGTPGFNQTGAVNFWAAEASQYNPRHPQMSHFTQLVWRNTARVGCASANCPRLMNNNVGVFHVCEYDPPGNYAGQYSQNVIV